MPKSDGRLTLEERKVAEEWIREKAPNLKCPTCRNNNFQVSEHMISPQIFYGGGNVVIGGGIAYPQVMLNCNFCGHTMLYNAVQMGVVKSEPVSSPTEAEDG